MKSVREIIFIIWSLYLLFKERLHGSNEREKEKKSPRTYWELWASTPACSSAALDNEGFYQLWPLLLLLLDTKMYDMKNKSMIITST